MDEQAQDRIKSLTRFMLDKGQYASENFQEVTKCPECGGLLVMTFVLEDREVRCECSRSECPSSSSDSNS